MFVARPLCPPSARPSFEQLEDRCVPATLIYAGVNNGLWSDPTNWLEDTGVATLDPPGPNDTVIFDGNVSLPKETWTGGVTEVASVIIDGPWDKNIQITTAQHHSSSLRVNTSFTMNAADAGLTSGATGGNSNLFVSSHGASFTWTGGTIADVNVNIGYGGDSDVTGTIGGEVILSDSLLINGGTLSADFATVKVPPDVISEIRNYGTFSANCFSFRDTINNTHRDVGLIANYGSATIKGDSRIDSDFENYGHVRLQSDPNLGAPRFWVSYRQFSGQTELYNDAWVHMSGPGNHMHIHNGKLIGNGTIVGNVTLGYEGADNYASTATIDPGWTTGYPESYTIGTITITHSFALHDATNAMRIDGTAGGSFDKVVVTGYADLKGNLTVNPSKDYKPANGKTVQFLTASEVKNDFETKTLTYTGYWSHADNPDRQHYWKFRKTGTGYEIYVDLVPTQPPPP